MDTRRILQIILVFLGLLIVIMGAITISYLTRSHDTVVVKKVIHKSAEKTIEKNPWEDKGSAAIALVRRQTSQPENRRQRGQQKTVEEMLENDNFVRDRLKLTDVESQGWTATWWGKTKYGASFFVVTYGFKHHNTVIGPTWLVDLKTQKVVPQNVMAQVVEDPIKGARSKYYNKTKQVLSTITNHQVDEELNLQNALEKYLETRFDNHGGDAQDENVLGWTIGHERNSLFKAFYQWNEGTEATYAEFEFDFDAKALKAVNLHAAQIMRIAEALDE